MNAPTREAHCFAGRGASVRIAMEPRPHIPELDLDALLPAIAGGDPAAFGQWMATAEPTLRRALRPFARTVDVEAVLQEALLRVWQVAPRVVPDGRPNSLLRLAQVTAKNLALSELRRRQVQPEDLEALERALNDGSSSD